MDTTDPVDADESLRLSSLNFGELMSPSKKGIF